jgi:hypothetical protein
MSTSDKDQVISNYTEANIEAKGGWYSVDGGKNVRLAAIEAMIAELSSNSTPVAAEAKAEKTAKPVKKAAPKKAKKAKKSDFSVKAFWAAKITEQNPGAKLPR